MRAFAFSTSVCRHAQLLAYFGQSCEGLHSCPGCDSCARAAREGRATGGASYRKPAAQPSAQPRPRSSAQLGQPSEQEVTLIRKALAGVGRSEGRVGLRRVAGMLAGSRAKGIADGFLSELSTWGSPRPMAHSALLAICSGRSSALFPTLRSAFRPLLAAPPAVVATAQRWSFAPCRHPQHPRAGGCTDGCHGLTRVGVGR